MEKKKCRNHLAIKEEMLNRYEGNRILNHQKPAPEITVLSIFQLSRDPAPLKAEAVLT